MTCTIEELIFGIVYLITGVLLSSYIEKKNAQEKEDRRIKKILIKRSIRKEIERLKSFGFENVYKD